MSPTPPNRSARKARATITTRVDLERDEEPQIHVEGVSHHFGIGEARKQVLDDIDLQLMPGEIVIMTGPSGSGKTTLLTLIGALRSVQQGSLQVRGQELANLTSGKLVEIRRQIGFIFQAHNLFPSLTAWQNVSLALALSRDTRAVKNRKITEILTRLGLAERLHYKPQALSGGQRQRVAIARALVNRPPLVLADEPTAALDHETGRQVVELLRQRASEDLATIMIVTHDNRILDVADRIVNMVDGRIVSNVAVKEAVLICQILMKSPTFMEQPSRVLSGIAENMVREKFRAGSTIIRQGDVGDKFYLIRLGSCDVLREEEGTSKMLATLGSGTFFGETALLTGHPRNATVVARTDVLLYSLGKQQFRDVLAASTSLQDEVQKVYFART